MKSRTNTFMPSRYSRQNSMSYGFYGDDATDPTTETETSVEGEEKEESSYGQYGSFVRNLLGLEKTKQEQRDALKAKLWILENGNIIDRQGTAFTLGVTSVDAAITKVKMLLVTAEKEARGEMIRNFGITTIALGGGALVLAGTALVATKAYGSFKQAQLTSAQIKQIQGS